MLFHEDGIIKGEEIRLGPDREGLEEKEEGINGGSLESMGHKESLQKTVHSRLEFLEGGRGGYHIDAEKTECCLFPEGELETTAGGRRMWLSFSYNGQFRGRKIGRFGAGKEGH